MADIAKHFDISPQTKTAVRKAGLPPRPILRSAKELWTQVYPRFEFDRHSGLPIFWINDHCVLVTLLVFCSIGHIEANGDLLKHMRDPQDH